ncbi:myeloid differentiation primary response protein MyD88-like isoform X1 [Leptotrombidium deliense]|uniref:Myeloid differentiation primary response protein MyD88-like isoform X1 n=1 Tax=Leptotrombidium deliense TaxID=299467 RepID=A0A443SGT8_9ACAR|nr:myeloid differentiation primary response protein MyD88-like isoform X1 [Leptotrombidium deliense]
MTDEVIDAQPVFNCDSTPIPIRALNISSRLLLSASLNAEQLITTDSGLARDYRGLAELYGFSYWDIKNFQRSSDPCKALLDSIDSKRVISDAVNNHEYSFQHLTSMLEQIERFDVIDDLTPYLISDANKYLSKQRNGGTIILTLHFSISAHESESRLTVDDELNDNETTKYDAFICYADNDYEFVRVLTTYLESPEIGLKLFIRDRDLLPGTWEYDSFTKVMEKRCERMVIVLTPDFLNSPECEYQARFAAGIAVERRDRILIPVILKPCELPATLKQLTKIDFVKSNGVQEWMWRKLVISIRGSNKHELTPSKHKQLEFPKTPSPASSTQSLDSGSITPQFPIVPTAPPLFSSKTSINELTSPITSTTCSLELNDNASNITNSSITTGKAKKSHSKNWYKSIKQKITGSSSSSSIDANGYQALKN